IALRGVPQSKIVEGDECEARFHNVMEDDFNPPRAFAELSALVTESNKTKTSDRAKAARHGAMLRRLGAILGLFQQDPEEYLRRGESAVKRADGLDEAAVEALVAKRIEARKQKNWAES